MVVEEKIVDDMPRLEYTYKIKSGPSTIKSYGLALARCLRFPTSLLDRAEELLDQIQDETYIRDDEQENARIGTVDKELNRAAVDLYSYILLLLSCDRGEKWIDIGVINQKLKTFIEKMSPEFREFVYKSPLEDVIKVLNSSKSSSGS